MPNESKLKKKKNFIILKKRRRYVQPLKQHDTQGVIETDKCSFTLKDVNEQLPAFAV